MTPTQLQLIHLARRQLGLSEADYRLILRNVAGVESAKDLTNRSFEDVMAVLEDRGWQQLHQAPDYWRVKVEDRSRRADARQVHLIGHLAAQTQYRLEGLCMRFSEGRTDQPEKLTPHQAWQLIEMLKASIARSNRSAAPREPGLFEPAPF